MIPMIMNNNKTLKTMIQTVGYFNRFRHKVLRRDTESGQMSAGTDHSDTGHIEHETAGGMPQRIGLVPECALRESGCFAQSQSLIQIGQHRVIEDVDRDQTSVL